jgi:hypothetical protein
MKHVPLFASVLLLLGMAPGAAGAHGLELAPGQLVKAPSSSSVYYIDKDLSRHAFPNAKVYMTWYADFSGVVEVSDEEISKHPLAGLVPYKAAKRLVKLQTDPRVYAVDEGGVLRWVRTEAAARALYGENWNALVDDLSDAFFPNYTMGDDIEDDGDFDSRKHRRIRAIWETLLAKRLKHVKDRASLAEELMTGGFGKNKQAVCHKTGDGGEHTIFIAKPAVPAHLGHGDTLGECAAEEPDEDDETPPVLSDAVVTNITTTSVAVEFATDEDTDATVYFSTTTPVDTETADSEGSAAAGMSHSIELTGLAPETTYHVVIEATDAAGNATLSSEMTFTTDAPDTTDPVIDSQTIDTVTETSAEVHIATDEPTTAIVYFSTTTPVDTGTALSAVSATLSASHDVELTGLAAGTTYHVLAVVTDDAGNVTTSTETSFATEAPDTTPPALVGSVTIDEIGETSAEVSFATDEPTTAKVYFSTTTPVDADTAPHADSATLAAAHSVELTGLSAETEYRVLIVLSDEAGNDTTLAEATFTTAIAP